MRDTNTEHLLADSPAVAVKTSRSSMPEIDR